MCGTPKVFSIAGVSLVLLGLVTMILAFVLMGQQIPRDKCGPDDRYGVDDDDAERFDGYIRATTVPAVIGSVLLILGGAFGVWGGMKASRCGLGTSAALYGIAFGLFLVGGLWGWLNAHILSDMCEKYVCEGTPPLCGSAWLSSHAGCNDDNVCCYCEDENGGAGSSMCKTTHEAICENAGTYWGKTVMCFIAGIIGVVFSCLACGATCCCQPSFGMGEEVAKNVDVAAAPPVVGQPIGQPVVQAVAADDNNNIAMPPPKS